jgi:hypothetical protein
MSGSTVKLDEIKTIMGFSLEIERYESLGNTLTVISAIVGYD